MNIVIGGFNNERIPIINAANFYKIKNIFNTFNEYSINRILIPGGFTLLLEIFNIHINKFIKYYFKQV